MAFNPENARRLLLETSEILDGIGIPFFLIQGTALGAYRDGGFVPSEKDIDLGILQENLTPKSLLLLSRLVLAGYDVEAFTIPFTTIRTIVGWKYGQKIDLVGMGLWEGKRFTASPVRDWVKPPYAIVHERSMLERHDTVNVFGRHFAVPSPIERYLELEYGPGWLVPADDHVSRTRIYDFVERNNIPADWLERPTA